MNDTPDPDREENDRLLRLLEAVTGPGDGVEASPHDHRDEYVALRATWLAFGRLLDAASDAQSVEMRSARDKNKPTPRSLVERSDLSESITAHLSKHERQVRRLRRILAIAVPVAVACCILLEVGIHSLNGWLARQARQVDRNLAIARQNPPQPAADSVPAQQRPAVADNNAPTIPIKSTAHRQSTSAKTPAWDDAIDDQITLVSQQIESVRHTWGHRVDDVDLVQYGVDEVSDGLSKDAL